MHIQDLLKAINELEPKTTRSFKSSHIKLENVMFLLLYFY